jgi:hypothetical protein
MRRARLRFTPAGTAQWPVYRRRLLDGITRTCKFANILGQRGCVSAPKRHGSRFTIANAGHPGTNDVGRSQYIVNHIVRPQTRAFMKQAVAGADEEGRGAKTLAQFDIARFIADDKRGGEIEMQFPRGSIGKSRLRLPAIAAIIGNVRTHVNPC